MSWYHELSFLQVHAQAGAVQAAQCRLAAGCMAFLIWRALSRVAQVTLFDVQQRSAVADLATPFIKYVVWSADMGHVALLSKHAIIIANKRLGQASTGARPLTAPSQALPSVGRAEGYSPAEHPSSHVPMEEYACFCVPVRVLQQQQRVAPCARPDLLEE
jgi:hypothetical protein